MQKMKSFSLQIVAVLLAIGLVTFSCSKDNDGYTCTSCTSEPTAAAANDNIHKGIYKGVVIGSTGTIIFNIENTTNTITAKMVIDGNVVNLTSDDELNVDADFTGTFTGTLNGSPVTITFRVTDGGTGPEIISSSIPGHPNAHFLLSKERSNALLECYEGSYSVSGGDPETGTYNILVVRNGGAGTWKGISTEDGFPDLPSYGDGIMSGNNIVEVNRNDEGVDVTLATISGFELSGQFTETDDEDNQITYTLKGKRTL